MDIQKKIDSLNPWYYEVDISGVKTVPGIGVSGWDSDKLKARQIYIEKLLVDNVYVDYNFVGKSVLDIGCNCGYYGSRYVELGVTDYTGLEGRELFINQANLYWGNNKFGKQEYSYRFHQVDLNNIKELSEILHRKKYDILLCAGILYHIKDYKGLLDSVLKHIRDIAIIDTRVSAAEERVIKEPGDLNFNAIPSALDKVIPNYKKLHVYLSGKFNRVFRQIITTPTPPGLKGVDDFYTKRRVVIICKDKK